MIEDFVGNIVWDFVEDFVLGTADLLDFGADCAEDPAG